MAALTERPGREIGTETAELHRRLRTMTTVVVVLAVALVGLGAWAIYDFVSESDTAVTGEIEALLDDYREAWNEYDSEAFLALVTDDYVFEFAGDTTPAEEQAVEITANEAFQGNVEKVGDPIMFGSGPRYFVAQANRTTSTDIDMDAISLFTIVQQGDVFQIERHAFVGGID